MVLFTLGSSLLVRTVLASPPAAAANTAISSFSKTGTDATNPSTATVGSPGVAQPGDTLNWVLNYQNNTSGLATANLTDPVTGNQTYVPGSLQAPPGFTPEWSTDGGSTYSTAEPPSGVNAIGATGTDVTAPGTGLSLNLVAPSQISAGTSSGDGFNPVFYGGNVYNEFHATYPAHGSRDAELDCHVLSTGARCTGVFTSGTAPGAWVSNVAGAALTPGITGASAAQIAANAPTWSSSSNTSAVDQANGHLFYAATFGAGTQTGTGVFGTQCVDLTNNTSCGFVPLGTSPGTTIQRPIASGGAAIGNNFYILDYTGRVDCLNMATNAACTGAAASVLAYPGYVANTAAENGTDSTMSGSQVVSFDNRYLFTKFTADNNTGGNVPQYLSCVDTTTNLPCTGAGWVALNTFTGAGGVTPPTSVSDYLPTGGSGLQNTTVLPILSVAGTLTGVCTTNSTVVTTSVLVCFSLATGASVSIPYPPEPAGTGAISDQGLGQVGVKGTKVYTPYYNGTSKDSTYTCYDFSTGAACAGFTPLVTSATDVRPYSIAPVLGTSDCMAEDGDAGVIQFFSATTGNANCSDASGQLTVSPSSFYCDGGSGHVTAWQALNLVGVTSADYASAMVTITDSMGNPVTGFNNITVPNTVQTVDLSGIPTTGTTATLHVSVTLINLHGAPNASFNVLYAGDAAQVCYQTQIPATCIAPTAVSNVANAVTTNGATTDGPAGNSSGTVTFNESATGAECGLAITKMASESSAEPGDTVTYTVTVTNTGTVAYPTASFTDSLAGTTGDATYVAGSAAASSGTVTGSQGAGIAWSGPVSPGATVTVTYKVLVDNPDTGPGDLTNTVVSPTLNTNCAAGSVDPACSTSTPVSTPTPGISVLKSVTSTGPYTAVGQTVSYKFVATNTGNVTLTAVGITDTQTAPAGSLTTGPTCSSLATPAGSCSGSTTSLVPGQSATFTATYTLIQADLDKGSVDDSATAGGTPPTGPSVTSTPSTATVTTTGTPGISVLKSVTSTGPYTAVGQTVSYKFVATNTGNVTLTAVGITDTQTAPAGSLTTGPTCSSLATPAGSCSGSTTSLVPGQSATFTATYTLIQADLDKGSVDDSATAGGTPPTGPSVTSTPSTATVTTTGTPGISVLKSVTSTGPYTAVGQTVSYKFVATNTGNVTLTAVGITDTQTAPAGSLTTGPTCSSLATPAGSCSGSTTSLVPGQSATFTATYTLIQADLDKGSVDDSATAGGTPPTGPSVTSTPSTATVTTTGTPSLTVTKSTTATNYSSVGQVITYSITATNAGNLTMANVSVTDANATVGTCAPTIPVAALAPGASITCSATHVVTQADLDAANITNIATATGTPPGGPPTPFASPPVVTPSVQTPGISVLKSVTSTGPYTAVGQTVSYKFVATNTGNVTLTAVGITDTQTAPAGSLTTGPTCSSLATPAGSCSGSTTSLVPGQSATFTATYTLIQADLDKGSVDDSATAGGTPPTGPSVTSTPSTATVTTTGTPSLTVTKSTTATNYSSVGQVITYSITATNAGNLTMANVSVTDANATVGTCAPTIPVAALAPGASITCSATHVVTQADLDAANITNIATATGTPPGGPPTPFASPPVVTPSVQTPGISVLKSVTSTGPYTAVGQTVSYKFVATNTGNVTLTAVGITDTQTAPAGSLTTGPTCSSLATPAGSCSGSTTSLVPGQSATFTATYTLIQADLDKGSVDDSATAGGTPPTGPSVTSTPSTATVTTTQTPGLSLIKSASEPLAQPGDTVTYTITVRNIGNVTYGAGVPDASFSDSLSGLLSDSTYVTGSAMASAGTVTYSTSAGISWSGGLAVGAGATVTYQVRVDSPDQGPHRLTNVVMSSALGSSCPPTGTLPATCSTTTPVSGLHLSKTADASVANPGDTVAYTVVVSNTGNAAYGSGSLPDASFSDSLTGVHADTTFVPGSAKDTTGNVTYSSATGISWSGPLPVGGSATVTYRVLVDQPDSGPHTLTNTVVSGDPGNNCATGSTDPACSTRTLVTGLAITIQVCGSESAAACGPGGSGPWSDSVVIPSGGTAYWRIVVTNNGAAPLNGITLSDPSAPSCQSAAGTFALGVGQTLNVYCTTADVTGPISNTATATYPAQTGAPPESVSVTTPKVNATVTVVSTPGTGLAVLPTAGPPVTG